MTAPANDPGAGGVGGGGGTGGGGTGGGTPPDGGAGLDVRRDMLAVDTRPPDVRPPDMRAPNPMPPPPDAAMPDAQPPPPDTTPGALISPPPADAGPAAAGPCTAPCAGLRGEYFDNDDFTMLKVVRQDPQIDFIWEDLAPDPSMGNDTFSIRWTGQIRPRFSESTTFSVEANDNVRLWVAGRQILNVFDNNGRRVTDAAPIDLRADQPEDIVIEYRERTGDAQIRLFWRSPSLSRQGVPAAALSWSPPPAGP